MSAISVRRILISAVATISLGATGAAVATGATAAPVGAATSCLPGFTDAGNGVCTADFLYTGAPQTVTLPSGGWYAVTIDAYGAQGGNSREDGVGQSSVGGNGGREQATVVRQGGTALTLVVGQQGTTHGGGGAGAIVGGYGGGGQPPSVYGGGGGGGSFVFDANGPVVVAGGGGGGGFDANPTWCGPSVAANQESPGGAGAGAVGPAGNGLSVAFACDPTFNGPQHFPPGGGQGATASGPGAGGVPGTPPNDIFGQTAGDAGQGPAVNESILGVGGNGGGTTGGSGCFSTWSGAGGGGYYGGGGGGDIPCDLEGGGGGGAVGYVDASATNTLSQTGVQLADGMITLSYTTTTAPPTTSVSLTTTLATPVFGQKLPLVASVTSPLTGRAKVTTGTVDLYDGASLVATAPVRMGRARWQVRTLATGAHTLRAVYSGAGVILAGTSADLAVDIAPATTALKVTGPVSGRTGTRRVYTARIKTVLPAHGVATGTVDFFDGTAPLGTVAVSIRGGAVLVVPSLGAGTHQISAVYGGDANHIGSTSNLLAVTMM